MEKPKRKEGIIAILDGEGKKYYKQSQLADGAYNQGLDDMDTYHKEQLEQKGDVGRLEEIIKNHYSLLGLVKSYYGMLGAAQEISKMIKEEL